MADQRSLIITRRTSTIRRTVAAVLAAGCVAAPSATAMPIDQGPIVKQATQPAHDVRSPDARDTTVQALPAAPQSVPISAASRPAGGSNGSDWPVIALALGGAALLTGGLAFSAHAHTVRRMSRPTA